MSWYPPSRVLPPQPNYYGFGSSNQVYSNSVPVKNAVDDGDGEDQPSRPYIPDASNSVTFTPFGSVPNSSGGSATMNQITLQPADATNPGGLSTTSQIIAGDKFFVGAVSAASLVSASTISAAGDITSSTNITATGIISGGTLVATGRISVGTFINVPDTVDANTCYKQGGVPTLHNYGNTNLFLGKSAGNQTLTGQGNAALGSLNLSGLTSGSFNTALGFGALRTISAGSGNTVLGNSAGFAATTAVQNTLVGLNAGTSITTGQLNICIGANTGAALTTESRCIDISDGTLSTAAANKTILGTSATTSCFIGGIQGVAVGGTPQMVTINPATNQLGSTAIAAAGVSSVSAVGASPNAAGATIAGTVLTLQPASASFPGVITTGNQQIAAIKTFTGAVDLVTSTSNAVGCISQNSVRILHSSGAGNLFLGNTAGNFTNTGTLNVALGRNGLTALTSGGSNTVAGSSAGIALTSGSNNVLVGASAGSPITTGASNTIIGAAAGSTSAVGTSNVVEVSDGTMGTSITGDVRIGTSASLKCYLAGIKNTATLSAKQMVVLDLATNLLEAMTLAVSTNNFTATLDVGSITTMTVRGAATTTIPIGLTVIGRQVNMTIPRFSLTAQSGSALTINLSGGGIPAAYYPTFDTWFSVNVRNGASTTNGIMYVTAGGLVSIQLMTGAAFTLPFGPLYDLNVSWNQA